MRSFGLSYSHVRKCGSLVVAWTEEQLAALPGVLQENLDAGDTDAELVGAERLRELEPALSHTALGAVLCPREAVVEPWLAAAGYAESARLHGARIHTSTEAVAVRRAEDDTEGVPLWCVDVRHSAACQTGRSADGELLVAAPAPTAAGKGEREEAAAAAQGRVSAGADVGADATLRAHVVVNCAGLLGDKLEALARASHPAVGGATDASTGPVDGRPPAAEGAGSGFRVTPRKGQFVVYAPLPHDGRDGDFYNAPYHEGRLVGDVPPVVPGQEESQGTESSNARQVAESRGDAAHVAVVETTAADAIMDVTMNAGTPGMIIEPVASQFTKGVIIWRTVYGNVVVGSVAPPPFQGTCRVVGVCSAYCHRAQPVLVVRGGTRGRYV